MVKDKRGPTTRLILGLIVVLLAGAAIGVAIATTGAGAHRSTRASSTRPSTHAPGSRVAGPLGVPGNWKLVFDDEFDGSSLNRGVWNAHDGWRDQNAVTDHLGNIAVRNGHLILTLAATDSGAEIGSRHFGLEVGEFAQARIDFAGSGSTVYNWPAFWASGRHWPQGGENDIAEGFGALTVNYHSPTLTHVTGQVPGDWAGGFHVYGIYRGRRYSRVYWDGKLVRTYSTDDDGEPETLLLTLGAGHHIVTGAAGAMVVDYVRAWAPA
jgi:beta-glucanase (GH16 family)